MRFESSGRVNLPIGWKSVSIEQTRHGTVIRAEHTWPGRILDALEYVAHEWLLPYLCRGKR